MGRFLARGNTRDHFRRIRSRDYGEDCPVRRLLSDGNRRAAMVGSQRVTRQDTSGEHAGFLAVSRNVTAERMAQQALRDAQVFAQNLINTAPTIIAIFDLVEQRNVFVGPQVSTLTGVNDLDYNGLGHEVIPALIHPDDVQLVTAHYAAICSGKLQPPLQIEYRIGRPDGGWLWLACIEVVHARDSEGPPLQILSASLDITRRHEAEAMRDLVMKELEHRIKNAFAMVQSIASMTLRKFCEAEAW